MNELQRQLYLSALGVDTYMPRWQLSFAPSAVLCELPTIVTINDTLPLIEAMPTASINLLVPNDLNVISPINSLMGDIFETKKITKQELTRHSAEITLMSNNVSSIIESFALSVWRPINDLMIIDSRNTKLALPSELLLSNILQSVFPRQQLTMKEDILRWPLIENSFAKCTANDARTELQTWLSVQCEIRPVKYLWLMGSNAAVYFLPDEINLIDYLWCEAALMDNSVNALILPSLNELLQQPLLKHKLSSAINGYHS